MTAAPNDTAQKVAPVAADDQDDADNGALVMGPGGKMMTKSAAKKEVKRLAKLEKFQAKEAKQKETSAASANGPSRKEKKAAAQAASGDDAQEVFVNLTPKGEKKGRPGAQYPRFAGFKAHRLILLIAALNL